MRRIWFVAFGVFLIAITGAEASEAGRFQVRTGTPTIMVDTATGKSWRYGDDGKWIVVPFARVTDAPAAKANTTSPLRKRWQKEALARKLSLEKTGSSPSPKARTTIRQIFAPAAVSK